MSNPASTEAGKVGCVSEAGLNLSKYQDTKYP